MPKSNAIFQMGGPASRLCVRTDYVQCVKPIFLPLDQGSRPCNEIGAKALTASQCEIVAKMEDFHWQGQSHLGGCKKAVSNLRTSCTTTRLQENQPMHGTLLGAG